MNVTEIKEAVDTNKTVYYKSKEYTVVKNRGDYDILCSLNNHRVGLTWMDGVTLNGKEESFFTKEGSRIAVVKYMYKDGDNFKFPRETSFSIKEALVSNTEEAIIRYANSTLKSNLLSTFNAEQVGLTESFSWTGDPAVDHCFHEMMSITIEDTDYPVDDIDNRRLFDFISIFEAERNAGWKTFFPNKGRGELNTAKDLFEEGKRLVRYNGIHNVSVVSNISIRELGTYDFWAAASFFDEGIVEISADVTPVTVYAQFFGNDEDVPGQFVNFMKNANPEFEEVAIDVSAHIRKCAENGIDRIEIF